MADLGADDYATREAATRDLALLGSIAVPELRRVLDAEPDLEVRWRILELLERPALPAAPPRVRGLRLVELLERIGTPEARDLLEPLTHDPDEDVRQAAADARDRLRGPAGQER